MPAKDEGVERFGRGNVVLSRDPDGQWVRYSDYEAVRKQRDEAVAALKKIDARNNDLSAFQVDAFRRIAREALNSIQREEGE